MLTTLFALMAREKEIVKTEFFESWCNFLTHGLPKDATFTQEIAINIT